MAYIKNSAIAGTDYNSLAGSTADAAASAVAATNRAGHIWGVGFGDRGYGMTTPSVATKSAGAVVAREWDELRSVINSISSWQNTPMPLTPPVSAFAQGAPIVAHERDAPSLNTYDLPDMVALLDTNRFNYQLANMALTASALTTTRTTVWGAGGGVITAQMTVDFQSENAARYFFNTGGDIRIGLNHPITSSPIDSYWNSILNNLSISLRARQTVALSGTFGTGTAIGYYNLLPTYQTIYGGFNLGSGAYNTNDFYIEAKVNSVVGLNGGNGTSITFRIFLVDEQTKAATVAAGTTATLSYLRAASGIVRPAPIVTLDTPFTPPVVRTPVNINVGTINNYTANTAKAAGYVAGLTDAVFNITGEVGSTSVGSFAFVVDTTWAAGDTVTVNIASGARVVGKGGNGGQLGSINGQSGGPAFRAQRPISLTNAGVIAGGGGGGGGGGQVAGATDFGPYVIAGGGGGGGGAGINPGGGGAPNGSNSGSAGVSGSRPSSPFQDEPSPGLAGTPTTGSGPSGFYGLGGISYSEYAPTHYIYGGNGGNGGNLGSAGTAGIQGGRAPSITSFDDTFAPAGDGGAAGQAISGLANINNGSVPGTVFGGQS